MEAVRAVKDLARDLGLADATLYAGKSKYGGAGGQRRRLREFEEENRSAEAYAGRLSLDREALKAVIRKTAGPCKRTA